MNITEMDSDLLSFELIGDDERRYDFPDNDNFVKLKQLYVQHGLLSVYLDLRPETVHSKPVLTRFKNQVKEIRTAMETNWSHDDKLLFEAVIEDVTEWLENEATRPRGKGVALFAAPDRILPKKNKVDFQLFQAFHLPEAPADLVNWGQTAVLAPLLVQKDEHPETGIVLFDREKVRFFLYCMGEAAEYTLGLVNEDIAAITKSHTWHGYGTHNHQQWQEEHYKRYLRQAAIAITKIAEKTGWKWLILASPDAQEAKHLMDFLPKSLRSKPIGVASLPMTGSLNDVRNQAAPIMRQAELDEEKETLEQWESELHRPDGLAVAGIADTVLAAQQFRLQTLIFPAEFIQPGWQCQTCRSIVADVLEQPPSGCAYCESTQFVEKSDIISEIAIQTLQTDGIVEVLREPTHCSIAEKNGCVGGLLRY